MRELAIAVLFLATGPASAWAQAGEASSSAAHPVETAGEDVAVLDAPIGHRQPSVNDLPPSLRQKEETGFERSGPPQVREPATHVRQRPGKPDDRELYEAPPTDISPIAGAADQDLTTQATQPTETGLATRLEPSVPPAPSGFSTTTCWPRSSLIRCAMMRPATSLGPPAANGTTRVRGRVGQLLRDCGLPATQFRMR